MKIIGFIALIAAMAFVYFTANPNAEGNTSAPPAQSGNTLF